MKKQRKTSTKEIVEKHLRDPKHIITTEEIANTKVGLDAESEAEINKERNEKLDELNPKGENHGMSSYDILDTK